MSTDSAANINGRIPDRNHGLISQYRRIIVLARKFTEVKNWTKVLGHPLKTIQYVGQLSLHVFHSTNNIVCYDYTKAEVPASAWVKAVSGNEQ